MKLTNYTIPTNAPVTVPTPTVIPTPITTVVLTPAPINYGGEILDGDIAVNEALDQLNASQLKFNTNIEAVKKANNWGDDVEYNVNSKQWIKTVK